MSESSFIIPSYRGSHPYKDNYLYGFYLLLIFRYCNHLPSPTLRKLSIDLIKQVVRFQERLFKSDPIKGRAHRRYIVGFNEIKKHLPVKNKVKLLFVAPDLECVPVSGLFNSSINVSCLICYINYCVKPL